MVPIGVILGLYWANIGIVENKMKYAIMGYLGPTPTCMRPEAQVSTTDEA